VNFLDLGRDAGVRLITDLEVRTVKVMQRRATIAVALTLGCLSAPSALLAQPRQGPAADTPRLLVAVFSANDRLSGVQVADAIRTRVANAVNIRQLYVIPKEQIDTYLTSSGYKADSALGPSDLKELAKLLRGDEIVLGTVTRTAGGFRIEPRLALARDPSQAQALPAVDASSANDAARQIERSLQEARKQLADNRACESAIRDNQLPKAIAAARAGILKYPNAVLARLCLATAFQTMKQTDSAIAVVNEIRRIDPKNSFVQRLAYLAYKEKGDADNAIRSLVELWRLEPTNTQLQGQLVSEIASLGKPAVALPIIDTILAQNPGDPSFLRTKWQLTLAAAAAADSTARPALLSSALAAGEAMIRADTTMKDSVYFARQIAAASALAGQPQKAVELASLATQKFPNIAEFWSLRASAERRAGQLPMAQQSLNRLISINPKYPNAMLLLATVFTEMSMADSAVDVARRAVAAGEDKATWGNFLIGPTKTAWEKADASKQLADYERTLALSEEADRLNPTEYSAFFSGISSFFITADLVQQVQKQQSQKSKKAANCALSKRAQEMLLITQQKMPRGGRVEPKTAATILGYVGQYSPAIDGAIKQFC
jgi:tetratricopeptide (TPR) repeat protein